jgi:hypothetical protein
MRTLESYSRLLFCDSEKFRIEDDYIWIAFREAVGGSLFLAFRKDMESLLEMLLLTEWLTFSCGSRGK